MKGWHATTPKMKHPSSDESEKPPAALNKGKRLRAFVPKDNFHFLKKNVQGSFGGQERGRGKPKPHAMVPFVPDPVKEFETKQAMQNIVDLQALIRKQKQIALRNIAEKAKHPSFTSPNDIDFDEIIADERCSGVLATSQELRSALSFQRMA